LSEFHSEKSLAEQCYKKGQNDEALNHYKKCVSLDPYYIDGHFYVGMLYFHTGDIDKAESYLEKNLQLNKDQINVYFNLSCMFETVSEFQNALSFFKETVFCKTHDNIYYQMGLLAESVYNSKDAITLYKEALRNQPKSKEISVSLANLYIEEKKYQDAENVLKSSLRTYPDEISFLFALGLAQKEQSKFESAIVQFNRVVSLQKDHADSLFHLGDCCVHVGFFKQAESFYNKAYKLVLHMGQLYEKMGRAESAVMKYRKWIEFMEDKIWHQGQDTQNVFKDSCLFVASYYQKNGDYAEATNFKRRTEVVRMDEMGGSYTASDSRENY